MSNSRFLLLLVLILSCLQPAMGRHGDYDETARETERIAKRNQKLATQPGNPATRMASGVKEATVDSATGIIVETADATKENPPVLGTLEGARVGGAKAVEHAVKGAMKVATLGYADSDKIEVEQPKANSDDVTKFKLNW